VNTSGVQFGPLVFTISHDPYRAKRGAVNELTDGQLIQLSSPRWHNHANPLCVLRVSAAPVNVIV